MLFGIIPMYFMDSYYIMLVIPALILAMYAQYKVKNTFNKYSQVFSSRGITGNEAVRRILNGEGITSVDVEPIGGQLTDHFDPRTNKIGLSEPVYGSSSVASIGVAAHEAGHAIQYANNYVPIKIRNSILPVAQIGSTAALPLAILGIFLSIHVLINVGILLYSAVVLFQVVTLPVEFNASNRAIKVLESAGILSDYELEGAKKVLRAAAMTYVAAMLTSLMSLIRLVLLSRNRD